MALFSKKIKNETLILREFKQTDIDDVFEMCTESFCQKNDLKQLATKLDTKTIIEYFINEDALTIFDRREKKVVGFIRSYIEHFNTCLEFGISEESDTSLLVQAIKLYITEHIIGNNSKKAKNNSAILARVYKDNIKNIEALTELGFHFTKTITVGTKEKQVYELLLTNK